NTLPGAAVPGEASWVGRFLSGVAPLTWETVLLFSLAAAGLISRLWALCVRVMSHDEGVQMQYFDLFDPACPPMPPGAQLPLVLVNGEVLSSGGKISVPVIRCKIEVILKKEIT
ncbi:MAG: hypothetical protein Q8N46_09165, partial [Anaerolineales bacterium]|nr:hypothetical protein [Anaerolineales bacterium]